MPLYSVRVVACAIVVVNAGSVDDAQMLAMDADPAKFEVDEASDAELLTTADEIETAKRHACQVIG